MGFRTFLVVLPAFWLASCDLEAPTDAPHWSRMECIVKVELAVNPAIREVFNREVAQLLVSQDFDDTQIPLAGAAYGSNARPYYFFQFYDQCGSRLKLADELIEWLKTTGKIDTYRVYPELVNPSPNTIDIGGPHWTDGM